MGILSRLSYPNPIIQTRIQTTTPTPIPTRIIILKNRIVIILKKQPPTMSRRSRTGVRTRIVSFVDLPTVLVVVLLLLQRVRIRGRIMAINSKTCIYIYIYRTYIVSGLCEVCDCVLSVLCVCEKEKNDK